MQIARIKNEGIEWQTQQTGASKPAATEVTLQIAYAGVNRADVMQVAGAYPPPAGASDIPGLECSAVVMAVGQQVTNLKVGQRVAALLSAGGYAESVTVDARQVLPLPDNWTLQEGAGWLETFATAHLNVFQLANLKDGEVVFSYAGASGVGSSLIQLCREQKNPIYAAVGSEEKRQFCQQLGATGVFNRHQQDVHTQLKDIGGLDVILNPVAGDSVSRDQEILQTDGRLIVIGLLGGRHGQVDFGRLLMKRQRLLGSTLRSLSAAKKGQILTALWQQFGPAFAARRVVPVIDKVYSADTINDALDYLKEDQSQGKVVVKIADVADCDS
ncbi:NAD(P)H-quinone oxidoreductase [Idiomarina seosinensis]|uniref:NAD(P)H-quinone oxidoreductase n=1 Tax=Idiomarina seosinensis TaxID=281739 RepID=UPI00384FB676